jgi:hypothetical protein
MCLSVIGGFMPIRLIILMLFMSQLAFGQSLKEKRIKEEMLTRVDHLIEKVQQTRSYLKNEEVALSCKTINDIFKILPEHLMSIGTRMNLFDPQVINMEQETKMLLIYIHQRSNICNVGETGENLDIDETDKKMKSAKKMLDKQKKEIKKSDTNFENLYNYYYEFH